MKLSKDGILYVPDDDNYFTCGFEKIITKKVFGMVNPPKDSTFLDIGSNIGLWTMRLSQHFNKVYAVEPVREHLQCMNENFRDLNNVEILPFGASDKSETGEIRLTPYNCGRASLNFRIKTGKHETIQLHRLDDYIKETNISFIKLDVEGHEVQAINGMARILEENNPMIFVEVLKKEQKKPVNALTTLNELGYKIQHQFSDNFLMKRD